jgi:predicted nucleic acid-binding protein
MACSSPVFNDGGRCCDQARSLNIEFEERDHIPDDMKLAPDTDVLIAAVRSQRGASRAWVRAILTGEATLLLSVPLALQYEAVLTRPEHLAAADATLEEVAVLLDALFAVCRAIAISFLWRPVLRDADDEMVLEVAVNGGADRLLTFNERDFAGAARLGVTVARLGPAWRAWRNR